MVKYEKEIDMQMLMKPRCDKCKWWGYNINLEEYSHPTEWRSCECHLVEEVTTGNIGETWKGFGCVKFVEHIKNRAQQT